MEESIPPRVKPKLKSAPKCRNIYWCSFPKDAQLPEFWKTRPVIIISKNSKLFGSVVVIPCTTVPQDTQTAVKLKTSIDGVDSWAVCSAPCTVAVSRLASKHGKIPRLPINEFNNILRKVLSLLPTPIDEETEE